MREAVGQALFINIILVFVVIFIILFASSTNYTKAFKVKNKIISIIEENNGYDSLAKDQINTYLGNIGYRISRNGCNNNDKHYKNSKSVLINTGSNYKYCVEKVTTTKDGAEQTFYGVTAYMYYELPIISSMIEIPIYGETKTLGILGN